MAEIPGGMSCDGGVAETLKSAVETAVFTTCDSKPELAPLKFESPE